MDENNCPIREFTADRVAVGRCWHFLKEDICPRHGDVSAAVETYKTTGKLTDEPMKRVNVPLPVVEHKGFAKKIKKLMGALDKRNRIW